MEARRIPEQARPYFVGNVALFGSGIRSGAHHHHFMPAHLVFPIDGAILAAQMTLRDELPVTFVPTSGALIDGTPAPPQVAAPVRIGKMSITVVDEQFRTRRHPILWHCARRGAPG